ncbi:MAG: hypothetical protein CM15mP71_5480 [Candidatus Poseidoniales archaeon]|nr:MAG: hypothetical protein CM15mP71_5480 [Candidatus Poseidoniales archaeon]
MTFTGKVGLFEIRNSCNTLPSQGLEVTVSTSYGSEPFQVYAEVIEGGSWETGLILPSRSLSTPDLVVIIQLPECLSQDMIYLHSIQ